MFDIVMFGVLGLAFGCLSIHLHCEVVNGEAPASWAAFFSGASLTITTFKILLMNGWVG